jgi:hypothetical protein
LREYTVISTFHSVAFILKRNENKIPQKAVVDTIKALKRGRTKNCPSPAKKEGFLVEDWWEILYVEIRRAETKTPPPLPSQHSLWSLFGRTAGHAWGTG